MPKQPPNEQAAEFVSFKGALNYAYGAAHTLAVISEPFTATEFGKRYFGLNVVLGGGLLLGCISASPGHETALVRFAIVWLVLVAFQAVFARWNHHFGTRQLTKFMGVPLLCYAFPVGLHSARRFLNPLLVFGLGCLVEDSVLAVLIKASAVGQAVAYGLVYAIRAADDDARSDALLTLRNH